MDDIKTELTAMDWKWLFLSFDGRINRKPYWMGVIVLAVAGIVLGIIGGIIAMIVPALAILPSIASLVLIYPGAAVAAKRWHDRGKSGWWSLVALIPLLGALYMIYECGILEGVSENNDFGANPLMAA